MPLRLMHPANSHRSNPSSIQNNVLWSIRKRFTYYNRLYLCTGTPPTAEEFDYYDFNSATYGDSNVPFSQQVLCSFQLSGWLYNEDYVIHRTVPSTINPVNSHLLPCSVTYAVLTSATTTFSYREDSEGLRSGRSDDAVMFETDEIATPATATANTKIILNKLNLSDHSVELRTITLMTKQLFEGLQIT